MATASRPAADLPTRDPPVREAIGIARVLCILGIVYVHAWTGLDGDRLAKLDSTHQGILRWVLIELVGRSAVPLLGAISGWLSGPSARKRSYAGFVRVKARTILAPMLLWNVIALVLVSGFAYWGHLAAPIPANLWEALDWIGCVTQPNPINVQISFLRDLFLCMCAAPLFARLSDRWLWAAWGLALLWSASGFVFPLLLRPPILLFFLSGMLARRAGTAERIAAWPLWACLLPYLLFAPAKIAASSFYDAWLKTHVAAADAIDLPIRFAAALALWRIALALVPRLLGRTIVGLERYAFLLFCCHLVLIWLIGPLIGHAVGKMGTPLYPPYLLLQPLLALGGTILVGRALEWVSRPTAGLLSGGRLAAPRPARLPRGATSAKGTASPPGAIS
ncbi:acyltransferase [uncultured Sphingomonas sp.]|uniref:acyltransferase family protein n=1 Tax=uncultured Sphingomonas sp. TaxID=158754 RepID=UPI0026038229|nr:acyltransferase [uncultured Sphingomonas sp.]